MTEKQLKSMANRIKRQRKALGYTQEAFSEATGLSMSSYSKIENAFQKPSLDTLIIIAEKLDISIDYIVRGLKGKEPSNADNMDKIALLLDFLDSDKLRYIRELTSRLAKIKDGEL